jgi:hypothetical protein
MSQFDRAITMGSPVNTAVDRCDRAESGGYACASYASGGGGASRVPRIAGGVTAGPALVSCVLVGYAPCAEGRRF